MCLQGWNNLDWGLEAVKWGADFLSVSTEADQHLLHIGDVPADHAYIGRAEFYPADIDRNIQTATQGALLLLANAFTAAALLVCAQQLLCCSPYICFRLVWLP